MYICMYVLLYICLNCPSGWASVMVSPLPCSVVLMVASVPSSYMADVITYLDEDYLAPSCRRHPASKQLFGATATLKASVKHLVE